MELLVFALTILTVAAIICISMLSFTVAIKALTKVSLLENELIQLKKPSKSKSK